MLHSRQRSLAHKGARPSRSLLAGIVPVIIALLIAATDLRLSTGAAQTTAGEVRANQITTADQHEPTVAVDPTNPQNVLVAAKDWRAGPKQVWYYRSTDGGRTWTDGHIPDVATELPNQSDPALSFDASGTAYLSFLGYNQNDFTIGGLFVAKSTDAGATWQKPVLVSANSSRVFNDKEWVTTDRSRNSATRGTVYTSWTLFTSQGTRSERGDIVLSRSTDGGATFSPHTVVNIPSQTVSQGSYPAIGPDGEVYVLYYSGRFALEEADPSAPGAAAEGASEPSQAEQEGPDALYVARSTDGGQTFPQVRRAASVGVPPSPLPGGKFRIFVLPALTIDQTNGTLYATWNDYAGGQTDIMLVRSTDGGQTWSDPVRVNDDPAKSGRDHFFPAITAGSDGALHVLWLDRRDDAANDKYRPYYARSTDGGRTFAANQPVSGTASDPGIGFEGTLIGDYIGLDVSPDGKNIHATWVDTRGGDQDIFYSQFSAETGPGQVPSQQVQPTPAAVPSPQPLTGFSEVGFLRTWERADRPVATGHANRPWLWGPVSFASALEAYAQGKGGLREVQYFDKARMEINHPGADENGQFFVTNGLLVVEMIGGRVQIGDKEFEPGSRPAAQVPVAGDINSPDALTYASLAPVTSLNNDKRAQDRTRQAVTATLNRTGQVGDDLTRVGQVKIVRYEKILGHNIPDVFWNFMNATGPVYNGRLDNYSDAGILGWESDLGYPITEPYWTSVKIGGVSKSVLVQAFQRRVLTYVADNPPGWQVEMGNVGKQYYDWRYKQAPPRAGRR